VTEDHDLLAGRGVKGGRNPAAVDVDETEAIISLILDAAGEPRLSGAVR
jgi:hypothetical protein